MRAQAVRLERREAARNMARFYVVSVTQGLFGDWSVERRWGRIGGSNAGGQTKTNWFESEGEAIAAARRVLESKRRRGYR